MKAEEKDNITYYSTSSIGKKKKEKRGKLEISANGFLSRRDRNQTLAEIGGEKGKKSWMVNHASQRQQKRTVASPPHLHHTTYLLCYVHPPLLQSPMGVTPALLLPIGSQAGRLPPKLLLQCSAMQTMEKRPHKFHPAELTMTFPQPYFFSMPHCTSMHSGTISNPLKRRKGRKDPLMEERVCVALIEKEREGQS